LLFVWQDSARDDFRINDREVNDPARRLSYWFPPRGEEQ
jgi:hypothetical protein